MKVDAIAVTGWLVVVWCLVQVSSGVRPLRRFRTTTLSSSVMNGSTVDPWVSADNSTTIESDDAAAARERNIQTYLKGFTLEGASNRSRGDLFRFPWGLQAQDTTPVTAEETTVATIHVDTTPLEPTYTTAETTTIPTTSSETTTSTTAATSAETTTGTTSTTLSPTTLSSSPPNSIVVAAEQTTTAVNARTAVTTQQSTTAPSATTNMTPASLNSTTTVGLSTPLSLTLTLSNATATTEKPKTCSPFTNGTIKLNEQQLTGINMAFLAANKTVPNYGFFGIKYGIAKRFQPPVVNTDHSYYKMASHPLAGFECPQRGSEQPMSEDCLYLNVFVPPTVKATGDAIGCANTPVVVFVHGGAYRSGSKDAYPGTDLAASLNAIIVIPNYRLGVFGFFSTGDKSAAGNWGLHDLKLVLKWTASNIQMFGGDVSRINLVGQSTGAALVSILMLDQNNRDLLYGAVAMSGSCLAPWAMARNASSSAVQLAKLLKCPTSSTDAAVTCLKTKSVSSLMDRASDVELMEIGMPTYGPVVDGLLVANDPIKILLSPTWKYTGSYTTGFLAQDAAGLLAADQIWHDISADISGQPLVDWFQQLTFPDTMHGFLNCKSPHPNIMKQVFDFYDLAKSRSWVETRTKLIQIATDLLFVVPAVKEIGIYTSRKLAPFGSTLYNISYSDKLFYRNLPSTAGTAIGASHALDLAFLFGRPVANALLKQIPKPFDVQSRLERQLITSVIESRPVATPIPGNFTQYLSLESSAGWTVQRKDFSRRLQFWDNIQKHSC